MSRLKLFRPAGPEMDCIVNGEEGEPIVIPFALFRSRLKEEVSTETVSRARALHVNRQCRFCGHPVIQPVELNNAVMNRSSLPIPGTATLVGFQCTRCQSEWPV